MIFKVYLRNSQNLEQYQKENTKLTDAYEQRQVEVEKLEKHIKKEADDSLTSFGGVGNSISGEILC